MKKPDPEHPIIKLSLSLWREQMAQEDLNEEDKALQAAKDDLRKDHQKELAVKVAAIIKASKLTKKQKEVFASFVETGSYRESARLLSVDHKHIMRVVEKVQELVKKELGKSPLVHK